MSFVNPYRFASAGGGGTDPLFSSTKLLLGLGSVNGDGQFTDESAAARGPCGNVTNLPDLDTTNKVFGAGSALFNGIADHLDWGDSADWSLNVDTTIEGFVYFNSVTDGGSLISHYNTGSNQRSWDLQYRGADATKTVSLVASTNGSSAVFLFQYAWTPTISTWYYWCLERSGNDFRFYKGPLAGTAAMLGKTTSATTFFDSNTVLRVGATGTTTGTTFNLNGNLDEVRYTAAARYATDAGYPVPTAAFPRS